MGQSRADAPEKVILDVPRAAVERAHKAARAAKVATWPPRPTHKLAVETALNALAAIWEEEAKKYTHPYTCYQGGPRCISKGKLYNRTSGEFYRTYEEALAACPEVTRAEAERLGVEVTVPFEPVQRVPGLEDHWMAPLEDAK